MCILKMWACSLVIIIMSEWHCISPAEHREQLIVVEMICHLDFNHQHIPCSTVLLLGGSCGSCLTLRAEDVTEEERDAPPWRWPLTQNNVIVKQVGQRERGRMNKSEDEKNGDKERKLKSICLWHRVYTAAPVTCWSEFMSYSGSIIVTLHVVEIHLKDQKKTEQNMF